MGLFFLRDLGLSRPPLAAPLFCGHWSFGSRDGCELLGTANPQNVEEKRNKWMKTVRLFSLSLRKSFPGSSWSISAYAHWPELSQMATPSFSGVWWENNFSWVPWYSPSPRVGVLLVQKKVIAILGMKQTVLPLASVHDPQVYFLAPSLSPRCVFALLHLLQPTHSLMLVCFNFLYKNYLSGYLGG